MKALYIDCGERDQFNLLYGTRRFATTDSSASHTAMRNSPTITPASITAWT